jgi:GNAT superfamily N-acetyltransferase
MSLADGAVIRTARDAERRACLMLLPELAEPQWEEPMILIRQDSYQVLGALGCRQRFDHQGIASLCILLRVLPAYIGQGLGKLMLQHFKQLADQRQLAALDVMLKLPDQDGMNTWLEQQGFVPIHSELLVEAKLAPFHHHCSALLARLRTRGGLISQASLAPLRVSDVAYFMHLYAEASGMPLWLARDKLEAIVSTRTNVLNLGLTLNGVAEGMLLGKSHPHIQGTCMVPLKVVAPHRQAGNSGMGWADLLLMTEAMAVARSHRYERVQFSWHDGNRQTNSLAHRLGAKRVGAALMCRLEHWHRDD